jgi:hypothetical protein
LSYLVGNEAPVSAGSLLNNIHQRWISVSEAAIGRTFREVKDISSYESGD